MARNQLKNLNFLYKLYEFAKNSILLKVIFNIKLRLNENLPRKSHLIKVI